MGTEFSRRALVLNRQRPSDIAGLGQVPAHPLGYGARKTLSSSSASLTGTWSSALSKLGLAILTALVVCVASEHANHILSSVVIWDA